VNGALNGSVFERPLRMVGFQSLARLVLLREWRKKKDTVDTHRFAHSTFPKVSIRTWFEVLKEEIMSHLSRFGIVEEAMCVCN
jgi:hypothetical protein